MHNLIAEYKHGIVDPLRLPWIETNDCMKMLQLPCSHFIVVYAAVFIYCNLICLVCVATCCVFFLTHSRKCQVSILFTLKFCRLQYRDEGFNCTRTRFTYDIVKGQFAILFSKALSSICFTYLSSAQSSRFAMFLRQGRVFFFSRVSLK